MTTTSNTPWLAALLLASTSLLAPGARANDFASTRPERV